MSRAWAEILRRDLPEVTRLAGREVIATLAADLRATDPLEAGEEVEVMARLLPALTRTLLQEEGEAQAARESLAIARSTGNERAAVVEVLGRYERGRPLAEDLRALDRHLDAEAVGDRLLLREHLARQRWEFLALALAARDLAPCSDDEVLACRDAAIGVARGTRPWPVRAAALALAGITCARSLPGMASARQALLELAHEGQDDAWVQVAALEAWVGLQSHPARVVPVLAGIALPPAARRALLPRDHAFVRARAAGLAARLGHWDLLLRMLREPDPSEHVQARVASALACSPRPEDTRAVARRVREGASARTVRAAAVVASLPPGGGPWIDLVATALDQTDPWVAEVVVRAVLDRRTHLPGEALGLALSRWQLALGRWMEQPGDLGEGAASLALWLEVSTSPALRHALREVEAWIASSEEGAATRVQGGPIAALDHDALLDVLAAAALDGFDLSARPLERGYRLFHGDVERPALWRVLHELRRPRPDKRAGHSHVVDRVPRGSLVAPSSRLTEVTPTEVPGRRVSSPTALSWGAELPLPAFLLAGARPEGIRVRTPAASWEVHSERWSPLARLETHLRYTRLASLRLRLLEGPRDRAVHRYDRALARAGLRIQRHHAPLLGLVGLQELVARLVTTDANTVEQLAALAAVLGTSWVGRELWRARRARAWRGRLPLVIGGWGSRGKSGTERLKAAVFHGLGYTVLAKTTGCEAMVVASHPGRDPVEVFLYRPYDKATIVEQRSVMELAAELGSQVFLWECMALNPYYVRILQADWVRDDLSTITNTYPDHEDVQGPSGRDVAEVIAQMLPHGSRAVTTEQHMTPVLRQVAAERGTALEVVPPHEWALLPRDLLARLPYAEHPRNVALVARLAEDLGIPRDVALKAMADHIVPDIGVLKQYGPVPYESRRVTFINGMSANERAGFLSNWRRMGLEHHQEGSGVAEWQAVVVNNRADRLARQAVFAHIAAMDATWDALVIIGTNVLPFRDALRSHLHTTLAERLRGLAEGDGGRARLVDELCRRLRRTPLPPDRARVHVRATGWEAPSHLATLYEPAEGLESLSPSLVVHPVRPGRTVHQAASQWLRETSWLHLLATRDDWDPEAAIRGLVEILESRVVPLADPSLSGDQVLHAVSTTAPPGAGLRVLGCSNIKGTGLDFVYRWLAVQGVLDAARELQDADAPRTRELLRALAADPDLGVADTGHAAAVVQQLIESGRLKLMGVEDEAKAVLQRLEERLADRRSAMHRGAATGRLDAARRWAAEALDFWDSGRRRREAEALYADLAARRVGLERAAAVAKGITNRQK